jgi:hypothetical protein
MAGRRLLTWSILAMTLVGAGLAGCTSAGPDATFEQTARFSGSWGRVPDGPLSPRHEALAVWLDGRFLVVGGSSSPPCPPNADCAAPELPANSDGAMFDPATEEWTHIAEAPVPVSGDNAVVMEGQLYVSTGEPWRTDSPVGVWRYSPEPDTWTRMPAPPTPFARLVAACHRLLAFSPTDELQPSRDFVLDEESGIWRALPPDPLGPSFDREVVWSNDAVLLTAKDLVAFPGSEEPALVRLARLDLDRLEWTELPASDIIGWGPTAVGELVVFPHLGTADGGEVDNWGRDVPFGGILDPRTGDWRGLPDPPPGGGPLHETLVTSGRTTVGGHLLDPATGDWTLVPDLPLPNRTAPAVAAGEDSILVWGGATAADNLGDGYLLRLPAQPAS